MTQLCINISDELKQEMQQSGFSSPLLASLLVRRLLNKELQELRELKLIVSKSQLTEKDVEELTNKVENSLTEKFNKSLGK